MVAVQLRLLQWIYRFDVWHVHYAFPAGYVALRGLEENGVPHLLLTCHGADIQERDASADDPFSSPRICQAVEHTICAFPALIAISESVRQRYLEMGAHPERILSFPNGVDCDRFSLASSILREQVRKQYGVREDAKLILTVGRHSPVKGYAIIPDVAQRLHQRGQAFVWLLAAGCAPDMQNEIDSRGLANRVMLLREIKPQQVDGMLPSLPSEEMLRLYGAADMLVSTSRMESFGLVILEAMAAGIPVVATDVPGHRDLVSDGVTGSLVPLDNPTLTADCIEQILSDQEMADRMSRAARVAARTFDWQGLANRSGGLYLSAGTN
jgi:glycosyltransferase involved in cell wall biosynthesis